MAYNKKYAEWTRKVWLEIFAPSSIFNEMQIGETPIYKDNINNAIGRNIDLNLAFLLGNFKYQNYKAIFKISKISGLKAYTEIKDLMLYPAYVRRLSKRGTSKIEDSFMIKTNDEFDIRVKTLIITRFRAHRSQKTELRKAYRKYLYEKIPTLKYYELLEKVINYDLQNEIKPILNKIFPVGNIEIRRITLLTPIVQTIENK